MVFFIIRDIIVVGLVGNFEELYSWYWWGNRRDEVIFVSIRYCVWN